MKGNREKCCIYMRVSTIDKQNTERQLADLNSYARYLNLEIVNTFEDSISGAVNPIDRDGFSKMYKYVVEKNISRVLIWDISRLGRNNLNNLSIINEFKIKGIGFSIQRDAVDTLSNDPKTGLLISLLSSFGEMEREEIKARVTSGVRNSMSKGRTAGYRVLPYGYKADGKKLVIDKEESKIIELIFKLYLEGNGTVKIANYLNSKGTLTRYNKLYKDKSVVKTRFGEEKKPSDFLWKDGTVYSILKNSIYKGKRVAKGTEYDAQAIISEEIFNQVQVTLTSRYNKLNSNRRYLNIFQGKRSKIICGSCGKTYFMHKRLSNKDNAYKCISKRMPEISCNNPSIGIDKLNNAVYDILYYTPWYNFADEDINKKTILMKSKKKVLVGNLQQEEKELDSITSQKNVLISGYMKKVISDVDYTKRNTIIEKTIKQIGRRILKSKKDLHSINSHLDKKEEVFFNFLDIDYFKHNINEYLNFIRIIDMTDNKTAKELFPKKADKILLVEVNNLKNGYSMFLLLSQREKYYYKIRNNENSYITLNHENRGISSSEGVFETISTEINYENIKDYSDTDVNKNEDESYSDDEVDMTFVDSNIVLDIISNLDTLYLEKCEIRNRIKIDDLNIDNELKDVEKP